MDARTLIKTRRKEILEIAARNGAVNVRVFGSVEAARQFFDEGWIQELRIPNWPNWLTKP